VLSECGQGPCVPVVDVQRRGLHCVHYCKEPLDVGDRVRTEIDWKRRWRHMQTHTGQHLISAVLEKEYRLMTSSWYAIVVIVCSAVG
jgi:misacylated tRNA(Ala) deacylase